MRENQFIPVPAWVLLQHRETRRKISTLGELLHLLGRVPIPGGVVLLAVLLSPQPADIAIFLEVFGLLVHTVRGAGFSAKV